MLTKLLTFGLIVIGALAALRAFGRAASEQIERGERSAREAVQRQKESDEMVRCTSCGSWVLPGETCVCVKQETK